MKQLSLAIICSLVCCMAFGQSIFTNNGTFTVPAGVNSVTIEVVGAGGKGGGNGGGGGGGGGYASGVFTVVPGATHTIVVGAGGSGIATSISGLAITASAGANGTIAANPNIGGGGAGGVGSGGTVNRTGGAGGGGYWTYFGGGGGGAAGPTANGSAGGNTVAWTGVCQTPGGAAGIGGGAPGGNGGKGAGFTDVNCNVSDAATVGANYGGGGGGGNGNGGAETVGSGGYVKISWCSAVAAPTGLATQSVCGSGTVADLAATGSSVQWYDVATGGTPLASTEPLVNGNHYFASQTQGECESQTRLDVTVNVVNLDVTTTLLQHTITANATGVNYRWINCAGNTNIAGANAQSYTATANGSYAVIISQGGCSDTSACVTISGITGIDELNAGKGFSIYPNPAYDHIMVQLQPALIGSTYTITDPSGKIVGKGSLKHSSETINIATLAKGIYLFNIGNEVQQSFKVVKK